MESPALCSVGAPPEGCSCLDTEGGGSEGVGQDAGGGLLREHGSQVIRWGDYLWGALRWAANRVKGLVDSHSGFGWGVSDSRGNVLEQAGGLHFGDKREQVRRLEPPKERAIHCSFRGKAGGFALISVALMLSGCSLMGLPKIKLPGITVQAPKDNGSPATIAKSDSGVSVPLPAGSEVVITKETAIPATADKPAIPAKETTVIRPAGATEYHQTEAKTEASTGTIDTTVRNHQIDVAERRWLLFVAIGCGIGGILMRSLLPSWPAWSNGLLLSAVVAGIAWKVAEIPWWAWLAVIAGVGLMVMGYKRAEWDKDGDGTPDFLQKKNPPPSP